MTLITQGNKGREMQLLLRASGLRYDLTIVDDLCAVSVASKRALTQPSPALLSASPPHGPLVTPAVYSAQGTTDA